MARKSKASLSRAKNLGKYAQKKHHSVSIEDIPEEDIQSSTPSPQSGPNVKSLAEYISDEGIITYNEDGSFTLQGFLDYFEEPSSSTLSDEDSDSESETIPPCPDGLKEWN
uniref:Uncharacterized protein n=1 Tax=Psilocybe cubensis TaxID=181762 RepID=A0A8H8CE76_PSICU